MPSLTKIVKKDPRLVKQALLSALIMGMAARNFFDLGSTTTGILGYVLLCSIANLPLAFGIAYIFRADGRRNRPQPAPEMIHRDAQASADRIERDG